MSAAERRRGVGPGAWHVAQVLIVLWWVMATGTAGAVGGVLLAKAVLS